MKNGLPITLYVACKNCGRTLAVPFDTALDSEHFARVLFGGKAGTALRLFPIRCENEECGRTYFYSAQDMFISPDEDTDDLVAAIRRLAEAVGVSDLASLVLLTPDEMEQRLADT